MMSMNVDLNIDRHLVSEFFLGILSLIIFNTVYKLFISSLKPISKTIAHFGTTLRNVTFFFIFIKVD